MPASPSTFFRTIFYRQFVHFPPVPAASFTGKTIIVTGATSGLGLDACRHFLRLGATTVVLACRDLARGEAAAADLRASAATSGSTASPKTLLVWQLDMASYASVLAFADRAARELPRIDVVLLNAGIATWTFRRAERNEETITVNLVSQLLLACLLWPKLAASAGATGDPARVVLTSSDLYLLTNFRERRGAAGSGGLLRALDDESAAVMDDRYNLSKLLGILAVHELAASAPVSASSNVIICATAPGYCKSALLREAKSARAVRIFERVFARPTEVGSRALVLSAAAGPEAHGQYTPDGSIERTGGLCAGKEGTELARQLWHDLRDELEAVRPGVTSFCGPVATAL
ncbi:hypothetical protein HK405_004019 [Cladochytrium tenue]|nr:hypothetical protein HK405_004019 [Cladochytrium tenue]